MTFNKRTIGADKEQLAAEYLIDNGYTVLERNFRSRTGEIDIKKSCQLLSCNQIQKL